MYNPETFTLLPISMFLVWDVSAPGTIKNLKLSPALKPTLAVPHVILPYHLTVCGERILKTKKF